MKKTVILLIIALLAFLGPGHLQGTVEQPKEWQIDTYIITVYRSGDEPVDYDEYRLYYGNEQTKKLEEEMDAARFGHWIYFYRISEEMLELSTNKHLRSHIAGSWIFQLYNSDYGYSPIYDPLDPMFFDFYDFIIEQWQVDFELIGEVLRIATEMNFEPALIQYNAKTGTIKMMYTNEYCRDKQFFLQRLKEVQSLFVIPKMSKSVCYEQEPIGGLFPPDTS